MTLVACMQYVQNFTEHFYSPDLFLTLEPHTLDLVMTSGQVVGLEEEMTEEGDGGGGTE